MGKFAIVAITETWLDSKVNDSELVHPNYINILSEKIGGGVALCVNNSISSSRRHDLEPQEVCEVKPNNQLYVTFLLY